MDGFGIRPPGLRVKDLVGTVAPSPSLEDVRGGSRRRRFLEERIETVRELAHLICFAIGPKAILTISCARMSCVSLHMYSLAEAQTNWAANVFLKLRHSRHERFRCASLDLPLKCCR